MKKFTIKLGERKEIRITRGSRQPAPRKGVLENGIIPVEEDEMMDGRRRRGGLIELFDLGTRLIELASSSDPRDNARATNAVSVPNAVANNQYVEINFDAEATNAYQTDYGHPANFSAQGWNAVIPDVNQQAFDAAALGSRKPSATDPLDPLDITTLTGGTKLPNCLQLPYDGDGGQPPNFIGFLLADINLKRDGFSGILIAAPERKTVEEIGDGRYESVTNPHWKNKAGRGYLTLKEFGGVWQLAIESRMYYEPFDTSDTDAFKVTNEPSFTSATAEFTLNGRKKTRVFLKPQWSVIAPYRTWNWVRNFSYETYFFSDGGEPFEHFDGDGNPIWAPKVGTIGTTVMLRTGMLAGRVPVILRPTSYGWDSVWDATSGAYDLPGHREAAFNSSNATIVMPHAKWITPVTRRTAGYQKWWVEQVNPQPRHQSIDNGFEAFGIFTSATMPAAGTSLPLATAESTLDSNARTGSDNIIAQMGSDPRIRNIAGTNLGTGTLDPNVKVMDIFPPTTTPAGALCAIIQQGSEVFYVWRVAAQSRANADYNRDNYSASYPF
ncbi:MAG: hypothetical protein MSG64_06325 [Pyrinomonadaceae bacterium MAG19_C2-C3]|nr:hypothetical protein [Pyrinomonadaceae bacterium MAG19_C2-C3]